MNQPAVTDTVVKSIVTGILCDEPGTGRYSAWLTKPGRQKLTDPVDPGLLVYRYHAVCVEGLLAVENCCWFDGVAHSFDGMQYGCERHKELDEYQPAHNYVVERYEVEVPPLSWYMERVHQSIPAIIV